MHYSLRVAVVQSFQNFIDVESNVIISEAFVQSPEVNIAGVNVLHDQSWSLRHWVSNDVDQVDDIDATSEGLKDFDFSSYFGFFDGF